MSIRVLDPRLDPEGEAPRMAPPLASLDGATVGLLDNAKIGTERFFDPEHQAQRRQRVAAGIEEIVVAADRFAVEHALPDGGDGLFRLALRCG